MKHVNKSQFKYYLDTNAIRKLSSSLDQYARNGAYASIWTLSELLGHIIHKPQDYHKYCVIIDNLFKSNVPIVKTWPADWLYESYGLESPVLFDSITNDIVFMCKCLKQYNSCEDWRNHISKYNIGNSWHFIVELDSLISYFKDSLQKYWKIEKTTETIKEYIKFYQNTKRDY